MRINDRFFKGGSSFRGFDVAGIGPRQLLVDDVTGEMVQRGDAIGGNLYAIGTLQMDVPLPLPESYGVGAAAFVEFGTLGMVDTASRQMVDLNGANRLIVDDSASMRVAAGVSIYWDSHLALFSSTSRSRSNTKNMIGASNSGSQPGPVSKERAHPCVL
ncbi:MAG: BamA/TamA family outer membrane protein [Terricaulis sp.]|nr:BamA/TamA family outer membrane protein [Terricaulis sp.]